MSPEESRVFTAFVPGHPAPQGSKRHVGNGVMIESSKRVKPWRQDVREAAMASTVHFPKGTPVRMSLTFVMPRPKTMPKGRTEPVTTPDLDKLIRAVLDALTSASLYDDDAQVVEFGRLRKRYALPDEATGVHIVAEPYAVRNPSE